MNDTERTNEMKYAFGRDLLCCSCYSAVVIAGVGNGGGFAANASWATNGIDGNVAPRLHPLNHPIARVQNLSAPL